MFRNQLLARLGLFVIMVGLCGSSVVAENLLMNNDFSQGKPGIPGQDQRNHRWLRRRLQKSGKGTGSIWGLELVGEDSIIKSKDELKSQLVQAIADIKDFLRPLKVDLEVIRLEKDVFKIT